MAWRRRVLKVHQSAAGAFSLLMESEAKLQAFVFDAFSSREPVPTSLENALATFHSLPTSKNRLASIGSARSRS
jgi:hypothetical protein